MLRELVFSAFMLTVEALVVIHWYVLPHHRALAWLALAAGVAMALMAVLSLVLTIGVLRRDPGDRQHARELWELGTVQPVWATMTVVQFAFIAAAVGAQVYWLAAVLGVGQGAELLAVAVARARSRRGGQWSGGAAHG